MISNLSSAKSRKLLSISMIYLIITMSFYIATAFADEEGVLVQDLIASGDQTISLGGFAGVTPLDGYQYGEYAEKINLFGIKSVVTSGSDGIQGFRKATDNTIIKAKLTNDGNGIDPKQIWLGISSQFDSCTATAEEDFECTITYPASPDTLESKDYNYNIYYYNDSYLDSIASESATIPDSANATEKKTALILVDNKAPVISSFEANPKNLGAGNVTFSYIVNDLSCDAARCSGYCAGIKDVRFYIDNNGSTQDIETVQGNSRCILSGSFVKSSEAFGNGTSQVYVVATDMFGQTSNPRPLSLNVDVNAPQISALYVETADGEPIRYMSGKPFDASFIIVVNDSDLDTSKVTADFTSINGQGVMTASCQLANGSNSSYECTWANVRMTLSASVNMSLSITAYDKLNNKGTSILPFSITVDSIGPIVKSITTNNDPYLGQGSTITVSLNETGIGLRKGNVYLDLTGVGAGKVKADSCSEGWTCTFTGLSSNVEGSRYIAVSSDSADDLGNPVTGNLTKIVVNDKTPPYIATASVSFVAGTYPLIDGKPTTGTSMEITATVKEDSQLGAVADLSQLVEGVSSLPGSCTNTNGTWSCKWVTPPIDRSGPYDAQVRLTFSDKVGNNISKELPVKVIGINTDITNPNYWASTVTCSPSLVDREVTPFIDMKLYCVVKLNSKNARIVDMQMTGCTEASSGQAVPVAAATQPVTTTKPSTQTNEVGSGWVVDGVPVASQPTSTPNQAVTLSSPLSTSSSYVASSSLLNNINTTSPVVEIVLSRMQMNVNQLTLTCPFMITSRVGDTVIITPELENATFNIYFYNNPQGEFGTGLTDKIDAAKNKAKGLWNILGWLHKIFFWAKKICDILYTINRVMVTFKAITNMKTTATIAAMGTPAFPMLEASRQGTCILDQGITNTSTYAFKFADKFCEFINCRMSGGKDQTPKAAEGAEETPKATGVKGFTQGVGNAFDNVGNKMGNWRTWGYSTLGKMDPGEFIKKNTGRDPSSYMNAKDNLVVALLTGCIPGIIAGVEKLRQIECMYGHCLQEGVVGNGVPITACEDQKDYAYCKYIFGEIFALIPFTAFFDYFTGMIKGALSDPLSALAIPFAYICKPVCQPGLPVKWQTDMEWCGWIQVASLIGEIVGQVQGIINADAWKIQNDYCQMLMDSSDEGEESAS